MANLLSSSIGKKLLMSISGIFLILFLTFHMSMNLVAIISGDAYNAVCEFLGANWYALAGTAVLAFGFFVHIIYAFILSALNQKARGSVRYTTQQMPKGVEWSSQNMFVLGIIVIAGIGMHLAQFWYKMQFTEILGHHEAALGELSVSVADGAAFIGYWFSQPLVVLLYIVWLIALWFHLTHGFWSALHTIGLSNKIWLDRLKCLSNIFATVICAGFALVVLVTFITSL
jgi:succinate dehydrogenase / fumarate reductase cytochrome b subunit